MKQKHPKHWLIITQYFPPEIGAPQIRLTSMIEELRKHNIYPSVLRLCLTILKANCLKDITINSF